MTPDKRFKVLRSEARSYKLATKFLDRFEALLDNALNTPWPGPATIAEDDQLWILQILDDMKSRVQEYKVGDPDDDGGDRPYVAQVTSMSVGYTYKTEDPEPTGNLPTVKELGELLEAAGHKRAQAPVENTDPEIDDEDEDTRHQDNERQNPQESTFSRGERYR